jgi:hypothetical protein
LLVKKSVGSSLVEKRALKLPATSSQIKSKRQPKAKTPTAAEKFQFQNSLL